MIDALSKATVLLVTLPLLSASLAGCIGDAESDLEWGSYEEAKDAAGPTFSPVNETDSPVRIKWLQPSDPDSVPQGQSAIWLLVYDSEADEPITDAEITMGSQMPAMGHGTAAETDPAHQDHGIYKGVINPTMGGGWLLNMTVQTGGTALDFSINYTVQGDGGMDGGHGDDGHDHGNETKNGTSGNQTADGNTTDGAGNQTGNQTTNQTQPEGFDGTFNDTISGQDYSKDWSFPVNSTNFTVVAEISVSPTLPVSEVNLTLVDANGTTQGFVVVSGESSDQVTIDKPPVTGDYTARVTGSAVDASYELTLTVG